MISYEEKQYSLYNLYLHCTIIYLHVLVIKYSDLALSGGNARVPAQDKPSHLLCADSIVILSMRTLPSSRLHR